MAKQFSFHLHASLPFRKYSKFYRAPTVLPIDYYTNKRSVTK